MNETVEAPARECSCSPQWEQCVHFDNRWLVWGSPAITNGRIWVCVLGYEPDDLSSNFIYEGTSKEAAHASFIETEAKLLRGEL